MSETLWCQTLSWGNESVTVKSCKSLEHARLAAYDLAIACGWTPPPWWAPWRRERNGHHKALVRAYRQTPEERIARIRLLERGEVSS